ncbi:MAG: glycosyltransferase family 8 protein [Alphaproteobacteria bacterium]|nr:glycosyltransferase family 8 protein [Alphaproteobacteria bacterium]
MSKVNILYCFDSKFWRMAAVSMESVLANCKDTTSVTIYCMVAPNTEGREEIEKVIKSHKSGAGLVWREIKEEENPFQNYEFSRWSPVIFYRCIAHHFFKDIDKILYLDSDTLICRDISELFDTDISDYVLGGVRDMAPVNEKYHPQGIYVREFAEKYLNNGPYINSGVLLINLRNIAKYEKLLFETKVPLYYPDQDLLNAAFLGKIKFLPLKYNLAPGLRVPKIFTPEEAREAMFGGHVIIHCYSVKPFNYERAPRQLYEMFSQHAKNIGMDPKDFMEWDRQYTSQRIKDTFVPDIKIQGNRTIIFNHDGKEIKITL